MICSKCTSDDQISDPVKKKENDQAVPGFVYCLKIDLEPFINGQ